MLLAVDRVMLVTRATLSLHTHSGAQLLTRLPDAARV